MAALARRGAPSRRRGAGSRPPSRPCPARAARCACRGRSGCRGRGCRGGRLGGRFVHARIVAQRLPARLARRMSCPHEIAAVPERPSPASSAPSARERVFSGVQPSGLPHVGNYLGAFGNYIAMQDGYDADLLHRRLPRAHEHPRRRGHPRAARTRWRSACSRSGSTPSAPSCSASRTGPSTSSSCGCSRASRPVPWVERTPVVQGEEAQPARRRQPRAAVVPDPPGRRHRDLQGALRAGRARTRPRTSSWPARSCARSTPATARCSRSPRRSSPTRPIVKGTDGVNKMSKSLGQRHRDLRRRGRRSAGRS